MSDAAAPLPCTGSAHLSVLVDELDALVTRVHATVATVDPATVAARRAAEDAATADATLRLDGGLRASADGSGLERAGTWLDALGDTTADFDEAELTRMMALEHAGVRAAIASDDLADAFGRTSVDAGGLGTALALLHGRLTAGLVADERAGRLRRGPRVVHDASVGRVLFFPTDPALLPDAWDRLLRGVTGGGAGATARTAPAVRAAVLHLELLRHQPFDAANGRVARAASRLALLADGLLPSGLGAADVVLAADPLGYHEEVGASMRRRDATPWVERALEAHGAALSGTLQALQADSADGRAGADGGPDAHPPDGLADEFTLGDVIERTGGSSDTARARCSMWVVAGTAERVVGTGGLRLRRAARPRAA